MTPLHFTWNSLLQLGYLVKVEDSKLLAMWTAYTISTAAAFQFLPARRYTSAGYRDRNVSVRLSVRHAPVLCQNEES